MIQTSSLKLQRGSVEGVLTPAEGGVLTELRVGGRSVLAATPWANEITPQRAVASTEEQWVGRWRGGWQLCFPSAGLADKTSLWPQGFHGIASQAPWLVVSADEHHACLRWSDQHSLTATRTWRLTDAGVSVETVAHNGSDVTRGVVIAEHLILGGDVLAPVLDTTADRDSELVIVPPAGSTIATLDYAGHPVSEPVTWPGHDKDRWSIVDRDTPARVAALVGIEPRIVVVRGPHVEAVVSWNGLPHALVWEELARSMHAPWNGEVVALGVEPTSAAHGVGTAIEDGTMLLQPGSSLSWRVELSARWIVPHDFAANTHG